MWPCNMYPQLKNNSLHVTANFYERIWSSKLNLDSAKMTQTDMYLQVKGHLLMSTHTHLTDTPDWLLQLDHCSHMTWLVDSWWYSHVRLGGVDAGSHWLRRHPFYRHTTCILYTCITWGRKKEPNFLLCASSLVLDRFWFGLSRV